jgi:hypothetical protein
MLGTQICDSCPRILNLHFTDDILLFSEANDTNIEVLQWILIGFERLSGMKFNFTKCELFPFNIFSEQGLLYASQLGCKLEALLIQYLGFLLHKKQLSSSD